MWFYKMNKNDNEVNQGIIYIKKELIIITKNRTILVSFLLFSIVENIKIEIHRLINL